ncbi:hypothetical protein [Endozoicomonas sp. 4G]|uniref:hypothetical protein n=1 Tax=Endozoicomonas sp. 4G TaxID=2872754 RepID=UPI0020785C37|nr:hypothetical protein [Endozoicomonas sp. 4G]
MNDELLQEALDALELKNIGLLNSNSELADRFFPLYDPSSYLLQPQFKHRVTRSEQVTFLDEDNKETHILRFHVELGARLVSQEAEEPDSVIPKAVIEATFVAEYELQQAKLSEQAISEFALKHVSFQVWPYWREYLTSLCNRMNLPKIILPSMQRAQNCSE